MTTLYSVDEIFALAEQIEAESVQLYRKAGEHASSRPTAALLNDLALMEERHRQTFADMRDKLKLVSAGEPSEQDAESLRYLRAMAQREIFETPPEALDAAADQSIQDVLEIALGMEKRSIAFYVGLQDCVPPGADQAAIAEIIREEMRHVILLAGALDDVQTRTWIE